MSALAAKVEAVEAEDMEVGLDYWLPGDVELQLQQTRESFDPLSVLPWFFAGIGVGIIIIAVINIRFRN